MIFYIPPDWPLVANNILTFDDPVTALSFQEDRDALTMVGNAFADKDETTDADLRSLAAELNTFVRKYSFHHLGNDKRDIFKQINPDFVIPPVLPDRTKVILALGRNEGIQAEVDARMSESGGDTPQESVFSELQESIGHCIVDAKLLPTEENDLRAFAKATVRNGMDRLVGDVQAIIGVYPDETKHES